MFDPSNLRAICSTCNGIKAGTADRVAIARLAHPTNRRNDEIDRSASPASGGDDFRRRVATFAGSYTPPPPHVFSRETKRGVERETMLGGARDEAKRPGIGNTFQAPAEIAGDDEE